MDDHLTLIHERVATARLGENPTVICRMASGWAVMGDHQFLTGYSLLLPDPVVAHLSDLTVDDRTQFLSDMALIGEAIQSCTDSIRINYEILGNTESALHAHVFPRYTSEPYEYRRGPVWMYPPEDRTGLLFNVECHRSLQRDLAAYIKARAV